MCVCVCVCVLVCLCVYVCVCDYRSSLCLDVEKESVDVQACRPFSKVPCTET